MGKVPTIDFVVFAASFMDKIILVILSILLTFGGKFRTIFCLVIASLFMDIFSLVIL